GPATRPHVLAQQVLEPGESRVVEIALPRGSYRIVGVVAKRPGELVASSIGFATEAEIVSSPKGVRVAPSVVNVGRVTIMLANESEHEETFRIERVGDRVEGVSAAQALAHP